MHISVINANSVDMLVSLIWGYTVCQYPFLCDARYKWVNEVQRSATIIDCCLPMIPMILSQRENEYKHPQPKHIRNTLEICSRHR